METYSNGRNVELSRAARRRWYERNQKQEQDRSRAAAKARRHKLTTEMHELKSSLACQKCGENHPATLDFHHRNPTEKEFTIAYGFRNYSADRVKMELEKCDVLCSNCHRKLHSKES